MSYIKNFIKKTKAYKEYKKYIKKKCYINSQKKLDERFLRYGEISSKEIFDFCKSYGISDGNTVFVNCSWNNMGTYSGNYEDFISLLYDLIGKNGTLLMPALSKYSHETKAIFDVRKEPTYTGLIQELFRKTNGVLRSLHPRHSMCGTGRLAQEILDGHEKCMYADGKNSPWDRLRSYNVKGINFGLLPLEALTFMHWIEDFEPQKYPFKIHEGPFPCRLIDSSGNMIDCRFYERKKELVEKERSSFAQYFTSDAVVELKLKGMPITFCNFNQLGDELILLRDKGIVQFREKICGLF